MTIQLDCYYSLSSPWAYFAGPQLQDIVRRHRVKLVLKPYDFQAVVLQMQAEKVFGEGKHDTLDRLTVSMAHPDGTAALLSGGTEVTAHLTAPPFSYQQLKDPRVKVVTQENRGLAAARNRGFEASTGTYVQFLDADDLWAANHCEVLAQLPREAHRPPVGAASRRTQMRTSRITMRVLAALALWAGAACIAR